MTTRFRDLKLGQHFKFAGGSGFSNVAKKISERCYVWSGKMAVVRGKGRSAYIAGSRVGLMKACVGMVDVLVEPKGQRKATPRRGRKRPRSFRGR